MSRHQELAGVLDETRRGRKAKEARAWSGTLQDRVRVTKRLPQAILKISSHNTGQGRVRARLRYISRQGTLSVETDEGITSRVWMRSIAWLMIGRPIFRLARKVATQ